MPIHIVMGTTSIVNMEWLKFLKFADISTEIKKTTTL